MIKRNLAISEFIQTHKAVVQTLPETPIKKFFTQCHSALSRPGTSTGNDVSNMVPVCDYISESLKIAATQSPQMQQLATKFWPLSKLLAWHPSDRSSDKMGKFHQGHANAVITGHGGLEQHNSVRFGASIIGPGIEYPNHRHPPEEGYLVISEGKWRQGKGNWFQRNSGETIHNPPNIWHAMKSGDSPLLAVWMLWTQ